MNPRLIATLAPAAALAGPALLVVGLGVIAGMLILDILDDSPAPETAGDFPPLPEPSPEAPEAPAPRRVAMPVSDPTPRREPTQRIPAVPVPVVTPAKPSARKAVKRIEAASVRSALEAGPCSRGEAVARIRSRTGCGQTAAYKALAPGGPFSDFVQEDDDGRISWRAPVALVA
jgi:hypothetical protein